MKTAGSKRWTRRSLGAAPGADTDELTAFERVAFEYVKAADVFAQVLNGTQ